ncbi:Ribonuclease HII [hydrothermal vent metagenome]|uniref:Ribonuclease HII n=1 Tax=hydrothermal vent metagenome TaxID=652676 RepID=A0A3B0YTF2_9ZZZZ
MQDEFNFVTDKRLIAGVDEVGRGPLAGPVVAAAVILDPNNPIDGLADSKKLTKKRREKLYDEIKSKALAWSIARAEVAEIDELNILQASLIAMSRAVAALSISPEHVLVDGNKLPEINCSAEAIIKGDEKIPAISAASIIAKVARDREMDEMDIEYPGYGFSKHSGYPTKINVQAVLELGVTPIHHRNFGTVRRQLER